MPKIYPNYQSKTRIFYVDDTDTTVTNSATETTVYTFTLPANTLNLNNILFIAYHNNVTSVATGRTLTAKIKIGTTTIQTTTTTATGRYIRSVNAVLNNATNTVLGAVGFLGHGASLTSYTIDMTANQTITVTMQWDAADVASVTVEKFYVLLIE